MAIPRLLLAAALLALPSMARAGEVSPCATAEQSRNIRDYYDSNRPGVPLPVPSRFFNVTEFVVATALPGDSSVGTASTGDVAKRIWASIEGWGATTKVTLVLSPASKHAFAFPSLVPITQPDAREGYMDVYADEGRGVHSHIQLDQIAAIFATDLPTNDPAFRTRGVSFFGPSGDLVIGVYASINTGAPDLEAVAGFERTWQLLKAMPQLCR